jgi:hypothetical protein
MSNSERLRSSESLRGNLNDCWFGGQTAGNRPTQATAGGCQRCLSQAKDKAFKDLKSRHLFAGQLRSGLH